MVGSVGYNAYQQLNIQNTLQASGQNAADVRAQTQKDETATKPAGTPAAQSQESHTHNNGRHENTIKNLSQIADDVLSASPDGIASRGSVIDVSV